MSSLEEIILNLITYKDLNHEKLPVSISLNFKAGSFARVNSITFTIIINAYVTLTTSFLPSGLGRKLSKTAKKPP